VKSHELQPAIPPAKKAAQIGAKAELYPFGANNLIIY